MICSCSDALKMCRRVEGIAALLTCSTRWSLVISFTFCPRYLVETSVVFRRIGAGWTLSRYAHCGGEKKILPRLRIEPLCP